jgi:hypothetical protein
MASRLSTTAPDIALRLEGAESHRLRQVAEAVASLAVAQTGQSDSCLDAAIDLVKRGMFGDSAERTRVQLLTEELDETQWDLQERVESGTASQEQYLNAFRRARAASTVWFALADDPLEAALESVYEAHAAIADPGIVKQAVDAVL